MIEVAGVVRLCRGCPDLLIGVKKVGHRKIFPARVAGFCWCHRQGGYRILQRERERENLEGVCVSFII